MRSEWLARVMVLVLALAAPTAAWAVMGRPPGANRDHPLHIRARVAEAGGWSTDAISLEVGQSLHLQLTSEDVVHGFAVGRMPAEAADLPPGIPVEYTLRFDRPGRYAFYCTRWCGPGHWRMRGTIEVTAPGPTPTAEPPALYLELGLDLDAPHPASVLPDGIPSADAGAGRSEILPLRTRTQAYYRSRSPAQVWEDLRAETSLADAGDQEIWDLVAFLWRDNGSEAERSTGRTLYSANCAACHGAGGAGDGVMAGELAFDSGGMAGMAGDPNGPADLRDPVRMLGASPALLQGKILRGGMGTGMPYFGPIFTEEQTWALVGYLYTFTMELQP